MGDFEGVARKLEAEAAAIRQRVAGASTKTQNPMRAEAAALERAARAIRAELVPAKAEAA